MTVRRMRFACWIFKTRNTFSEYAVRIVFPSQQWLHERASMLRYTYIACHVCNGPLTNSVLYKSPSFNFFFNFCSVPSNKILMCRGCLLNIILWTLIMNPPFIMRVSWTTGHIYEYTVVLDSNRYVENREEMRQKI